MKKVLIVLIAFATLTSTAQTLNVWEKVPITDEFGDPTGNTAYLLLVEGYFKNSATEGQELIAKIIDYDDKGYSIDLFEYKRLPSAALCYKDCFGEIYVKRANGDLEKYEAFALSSGGLYFNENSDFAKMFQNNSGETIKIYIKQDSFRDYGTATYLFTITIR